MDGPGAQSAEPAEVVAWNTDKSYLGDLLDAGVPTVPSRFFAPGETIRVPKADEVVVSRQLAWGPLVH